MCTDERCSHSYSCGCATCEPEQYCSTCKERLRSDNRYTFDERVLCDLCAANEDDEFVNECEGDDNAPCSLCGGVLQPLGSLGNVLWFRCRHCGAEHHNQEAE